MATQLTHRDTEAIKKLFVGRRIVKAELDMLQLEDGGTLELDDGTIIKVSGHEGCGGCSMGWYSVKQLATVDNAITDVTVIGDPEYDTVYKIHVVADAIDMDVLTVTGDDNGYYGVGYSLEVTLP